MSATCLRSARCAISTCAIRRRLTPVMLPVQCVSRSTNGMPPQRPPDTGFAKTAYWDSALNAFGVDPTLTAATYDGGGMTNAARVWVHPAILWSEGGDREWRLAYPLPGRPDCRRQQRSRRRLPRGAGLR